MDAPGGRAVLAHCWRPGRGSLGSWVHVVSHLLFRFGYRRARATPATELPTPRALAWLAASDRSNARLYF